MILKDRTGRTVEVEIECDGMDAYVYAGTYVDDGSEAPENVLDWLTDAYPDRLYEYAFEAMVCRAETFYEGDR